MKKFISICLCLIMLFTALPSVVFAADSYDASFDNETISLFTALGILDEADPYTQEESMYVTRREVARILIRLLGYGNNAPDLVHYSPVYKDVEESTENSYEILLATQLGLFGDEVSNYFYPTAHAKTTWTVEALARLLGYGLVLERNPQILNTLELYNGIEGTRNGTLRRSDFLKIISNALNVQVLEVTGIVDGGLSLGSENGKTILTEYLGIYHDEAVLEADSFTAVFGTRTDKNKVRFGNVTYNVSEDIDTRELVGRKLRYYYKNIDDTKEIIYFTKLKTEEVVFNSSTINFDYSKNQYTAYINGREKRFPLKMQSLVAYNGLPCYDKTKMLPAAGQVTIVDNNADGTYDVVIIREYINILVKAVNGSKEMIYDKVDGSRNLDVGSYENFYLYSEAGERIELSELKTDTVLTAYKSYDGKSLEAYVSSGTVALPLEGINNGENTIVVDSTVYKLSADYRMEGSKLTVGQKYKLYLNHWNEVVYLSGEWTYTPLYLLEIAPDGSGLNKTISMKGMLDVGDIMIYELADKITWYTYEFGSESITKEEAMSRLRNRPGAVDKVNRQLLMVNLDATQKIKEIVIAYEATTPESTSQMVTDYPLIHLTHYMTPDYWPQKLISGTTAAYSTGLWSFWLPFKSTRELIVPFNNTDSYTDDQVYSWIWEPLNSNPTRSISTLNVYTTSKDKFAVDYLVSDLGTRTSMTDSGYLFQPYLVADVVETFDEETGEPATLLYLTGTSGNTSSYRLADEDLISYEKLAYEYSLEGGMGRLPSDINGLKPGDIIAAQMAKGRIARVRLVYDAQNKRDIHPVIGEGIIGGTSDIIAGTIVDMSNDLALVEVSHGDALNPGEKVYFSPGSTLVEYDMRTHKAKKLTAKDLAIGSEIVCYMRYQKATCNYVFKYED